MSLDSFVLFQILLAVTLLLAVAHLGAVVFARLRQPPVIGEILGGLVLGPTVLGILIPGLQEDIFPRDGPTATAIAVISQLGLLFLMFTTGAQLASRAHYRRQSRTVWFITIAGLVIPFAAGFAGAAFVDHARYSGPHGSATIFALILGLSTAVTSIPVIARIMADLGILRTRFARVVLTAAALEDIVLYMTLAAILAMAGAGAGGIGLLPISAGSLSAFVLPAYQLLVAAAFLGITMTWGPGVYRRLLRLAVVRAVPPMALHVALLLGLSAVCVVIGLDPIFGALVAGVSIGAGESVGADPADTAGRSNNAARTLTDFAMAFFIPVYFATVGLKLDLVRQFDLAFFIGFLLVACGVKTISVLLGAQFAGESTRTAWNLAVAMNARGGPGIVIATVSLGAGVISDRFFTALVLLSIVTSQVAGIFLERTLRRTPEVFEAPDRTPQHESR